MAIVVEAEKKRWVNDQSLLKSVEHKVHIYIGVTNTSGNLICNAYHQIECRSLTEVEESIKNLEIKNNGGYNAIFIDMKLSISELETLSLFLRKTLPCFILCNKQKIPRYAEKFLVELGLIDVAIEPQLSNLNESVEIGIFKKIIERENERHKQTYSVKSKSVPHEKELHYLLKRIFDVVIASTIILLLAPLFIFIAIAIRLDSAGPIFYSSPRAGRGYKIFKFYKFRSMVVDADKKIGKLRYLNQYKDAGNGPTFFKLNNDPRVTRVGRILRNTSLDELPQLFNVLKGDMSLVGNRPLPLYEATTLTTNEFVERFTAPAGMTGYWQIKKRGKAEMSVKERMELDIHYARKASPLFDLFILASTPAALFQKSNV